MDEKNNVLWSTDDRIVIFAGTTYPSQYVLDERYAGKNYGGFSAVESGITDGAVAGGSLSHWVAYYPYDENVACMKADSESPTESYAITGITLPSEQDYIPDSFGNNSFPMTSISADNNLTFKNICGGVKLKLKGTQIISSIRLEGKNNEKLSGSAVVTAYSDQRMPSIEMSADASKYVILDCGAGVQLDVTEAKEFIIVLPPVTFTNGFTVTLTDKAEQTFTISTSKSNEVKRSSLLVMPEVSLGDKSIVVMSGDYIDEYGVNHGQGVRIGDTIWAPVNCGYHETDYKYGKLYQWGRKYGQGYDENDASVPEIAVDVESMKVGQDPANAGYFYVLSYSGSDDWCHQDNDLWNIGTMNNPIKTEYDPCPHGWRVPTDGELETLIANKSQWTANGDIKGYFFSGNSVYSESVPQIFLPAAGSRNYIDGCNEFGRGNAGYYWSSVGENSKYGGAYALEFDQTPPKYINTLERAQGCSVRCIRDEITGYPIYVGYIDNETIQAYQLFGNGISEAYKLVNEAVINTCISNGNIIEKPVETVANMPFHKDIPALSLILIALPKASNKVAYQSDGVGGYGKFNMGTYPYVNGEIEIALNGITYELYGEASTIERFTTGYSYFVLNKN